MDDDLVPDDHPEIQPIGEPDAWAVGDDGARRPVLTIHPRGADPKTIDGESPKPPPSIALASANADDDLVPKDHPELAAPKDDLAPAAPATGGKPAGGFAIGTPENPEDNPDLMAQPGAIARAALKTDPKAAIPIFAEHFKQPVTDFSLHGEKVIRKIPGTERYAYVEPETIMSKDAIRAPLRSAAMGAGQAFPMAGATAAGVAALPAAAAASIPTAGAGGFAVESVAMGAGGAGGEIIRQQLDRALSPDATPMDWANVGWQLLQNSLGPAMGKVIKGGVQGTKYLGTKLGSAIQRVPVLQQMIARGQPIVQNVSQAVDDAGQNLLGLTQEARDAVMHYLGGKTDDIKAAIANARQWGIDLSIGQATESPIVMQAERQQGRFPWGAEGFGERAALQSEQQVPGAVGTMMNEISPETGRRTQIQRFRGAAGDIITGAQKDQAKQAAASYAKALDDPAHPLPYMDDLKDIFGKISELAPSAMKDAMSMARARGQELPPFINFNEAGDPILTGEAPNWRALDYVKRALSGIEKGGDANRADIARQLRRQLTGWADDINPAYKAARAQYGDSADAIDQLLGGGLGFIQSLKGLDRKAIVSRVFADGDQGLMPEEIAQMRATFQKAGKLADWNAGVRAFVEKNLNTALKTTQRGDPVNVAGKIYQSLWGTPDQAKMMRAALGDQIADRWDSLGDALRRAAHLLPEGSPTITDAAALGTAGLLKKAGTAIAAYMNPTHAITSGLADYISKMQTPAMRKKIVQYMLTTDGDAQLRALQSTLDAANLPRGSKALPPASQRLLLSFLNSAAAMTLGSEADSLNGPQQRASGGAVDDDEDDTENDDDADDASVPSEIAPVSLEGVKSALKTIGDSRMVQGAKDAFGDEPLGPSKEITEGLGKIGLYPRGGVTENDPVRMIGKSIADPLLTAGDAVLRGGAAGIAGASALAGTAYDTANEFLGHKPERVTGRTVERDLNLMATDIPVVGRYIGEGIAHGAPEGGVRQVADYVTDPEIAAGKIDLSTPDPKMVAAVEGSSIKPQVKQRAIAGIHKMQNDLEPTPAQRAAVEEAAANGVTQAKNVIWKKHPELRGAPAHLTNLQKLEEWRDRQRELRDASPNAVNWYGEAHDDLKGATASNPGQFERVRPATAAGSQQAAVGMDLNAVLPAEYEHGLGIAADDLQPSHRYSEVNERIKNWILTGDSPAGPKTGRYDNAIETRGLNDEGNATIDTWMGRAGEYPVKKGWQPTDLQRSWYSNELGKLGAEVGKTKNQTQPPIWNTMVARSEGKDPATFNYNYGPAMDKMAALATWESRPGLTTDLLPNLQRSTDPGLLNEHDAAMREAQLDEHGNDRILAGFGFLQRPGLRGPGLFEGKYSPGNQSRPVVPTRNLSDEERDSGQLLYAPMHPLAKEMLTGASVVRGLADMNDAEAVTKLYTPANSKQISPGRATAFAVDLGRVVSPQEIVAIARELQQQTGQSPILIPHPRGFAALVDAQKKGAPNGQTLYTGLTQALQKTLGADHPPVDIFGSMHDGVWTENDWNKHPNGENYLQDLGQLSAPVVARAHELLVPEVTRRAIAAERFARDTGDQIGPRTQAYWNRVTGGSGKVSGQRYVAPDRPTSAPIPATHLDPGEAAQREVMSRFGSFAKPGVDTTKDIKHYDLQPVIDDPSKLQRLLDDFGANAKEFAYHEDPEAGVKFTLPKLKKDGYDNGTVWIYNPKVAGGSFKDEQYTRAWRVIHELGHGIVEPLIEAKYGASKREGRLGMESIGKRGTPPKQIDVPLNPISARDGQRAIEWEDAAFRMQRLLSKRAGINISDRDFAQEYNTNLGDALYRTLTGQFGDPGERGFIPATKPVDLKPVLAHVQRAEEQISRKQGRMPTRGLNLNNWQPISDEELQSALDAALAAKKIKPERTIVPKGPNLRPLPPMEEGDPFSLG